MKYFFLSFIIGATFLVASCSKAINPVKNAAEAASLRVMAYNIHHANPPSRPDFIDIDAIANAIKAQNPDLVALQEVDVNTERSGKFNQAEEIAKRLNMHFYFAKAIDHQGGDYGVAILSKYPLTETQVHRLPSKPETKGEPRVLATAKITLPNGAAIRFGSTHLDAQKAPVNRQIQIEEIGKIAATEQLPFIIAGDFNATPDSEVIAGLDKYFTRTCQNCAPTIPVINPSKTIDFIAYKHPKNKIRVASHQVINEQYASDHLPVLVVLNL
ncbi:endonuclease/exonuclease/phosphatase family protein [Adhaeribacter rhizoryzae]|nr:endonuclease/exonuclease/phosphatase family protein [Adhaeribacter rhizoryzae]